MSKTINKSLSLLLALVMIIAMVPAMSLTASAAADYTVTTFAELQTAVASATNGQTIEITASFEMTAQIELETKSLTIKGVGTGDSRPILTYAGSARHFTAIAGNDGVTFENLVIDGVDNTNVGGGISVPCAVTVKNCEFRNNRSASNGGAILIRTGGTLNLTDSDLHSNVAAFGGAMLGQAGTTINATNSNFYNNTATSAGGVIRTESGTVFTATGGKMYNNTAPSGGAIGGGASSINNVIGTEIYNNTATGSGGAIHVNDGATVDVTDANIHSNTANGNDAQVSGTANTTITIKEGTVIDGDVRGGVGATVNINADATVTGNAIAGENGAITIDGEVDGDATVGINGTITVNSGGSVDGKLQQNIGQSTIIPYGSTSTPGTEPNTFDVELPSGLKITVPAGSHVIDLKDIVPQSTDPNAPNYLAPGGTAPDDLYNIDITGDGVADFNGLPVGTKETDFDASGKYTGTRLIENPVKIESGVAVLLVDGLIDELQAIVNSSKSAAEKIEDVIALFDDEPDYLGAIGLSKDAWKQLSDEDKEEVAAKILEVIDDNSNTVTRPVIKEIADAVKEMVADLNKGKHVQFTVVRDGTSLGYSVGGSSEEKLFPGQEYELKIALSDFEQLSSLTFPLSFDKNVVEITGIEKGDAYNAHGWNHQIHVDDTGMNRLKYQLGTIPNDDYTLINQDGRMLLNIILDGSISATSPKAVDIPALDDVTQADESEIFFIVKFKVKDDATVGDSPNFRYEEVPSWGNFGQAYYYTNTGVDEWNPDELMPEYNVLTVEFDNPLVAEKVLELLIVHYGTKNRDDLRPYYGIDETFEVDAALKWSDNTAFPAIDDKTATWTATKGRVDIINGRPTYIAEPNYTGPVTITAVSNQKQPNEATNTYTFNVIDLVITNPSDPTSVMNITEEPTKALVSEFVGPALPAGKDGVHWTVKKDGATITPTDVLSDPAIKNPIFDPQTPGVYELTVTSDEYPEVTETRIITVTRDNPAYSIKGRAGLQSKTRTNLPGGLYTARTDYDKGIKVELVNNGTGLAVAYAYTDASGNYDLKVDSNIDIKGNGAFSLRFTRVGNKGANGDTLRNESYLCAILPLEVTTSIAPSATVTVTKSVGLIAGAFMTPGADKDAITKSDVQVVKSFIGLAEGDEGYDEAVDINEFNGAEGGDLTIVRNNLDKVALLGTYKVN